MLRRFSDCLYPPQRALLMEHAKTVSMSAMEDFAKAMHIRQELPADLPLPVPEKPGKLSEYFAPELLAAFEKSLEFAQDWNDSLEEFRDLLNDNVSREAHSEFIEEASALSAQK